LAAALIAGAAISLPACGAATPPASPSHL